MSRRLGPRLRSALWAGVSLAMVAFCALRLGFGTDITNFLPDARAADLASVSRELTRSELARTMTLCVGGPGAVGEAVAAARELEAELARHPEVAAIRSGLGEADLRELYALYFPRRYHFLSSRPAQEIPLLTSESALRERARQWKRELASPASTFRGELVASDPIGGLERIFERFRAQEQVLSVHDGHFVSRDGACAVFFLATRSSAFESATQTRFLADLDRAFEAVRERHGGDLWLESSGANRFAVSAEREIRDDAERIVLASFAGVGAVFLLAFRSLVGLGLALLPVLFGLLSATTAGLLVFGDLDGLTLAFGASLIGVAIDYPIHLLAHHALDPGGQPARVVARKLAPALLLGAGTTIASFAGLCLTAFPGLREVGLFAMAGVAATVSATLWLLPDLLRTRPRVPHASVRAAESMARSLRRVSRLGAWLWLVPLATLAIGAAALPRLRWVDDLSQFNRFSDSVVEEDRRLRERVAPFEGARVVVALADDLDSALARNDAVALRLEGAVARGELEAFRSLHALLWSRELQQANVEALRAQPDLGLRVEAAFAAEGFRPEALAPFRAALAAEPAPPLTLDDLERSPLGELARTAVVQLPERTATVTFLRGVRDPAAVEAALRDLPDVHWFDQKSFVNEIYRAFRTATLEQVGVGGLLVLLVLVIRYRGWRGPVAAFVPQGLVAALLFSVLALAREPANLLHVVALTMVMGMAVDYGIFLVDSPRDDRTLGATLLSLLLACMTTVLSLGSLVLSDHPALHAFGLTTGVGIVLSFLLAPLSFALLEHELRSARAVAR